MHSLSQIRSSLDNKVISSTELTKIYLDNIKKYNKEINAFITVCEEGAIETAKKAQKSINKNQSSLMTGIPLAIKDNICTKGIKTTCASKMLEDFTPFYNATAIEKLINQGAIILGKTNLDEFGMGDSNENSYFGAVKNPYNKNHVSGGSSGGSAASVAAKMAPVALGSDTGGSVRQPSALCGVTGLKPTYGTVSRYGLIAFASSLDQIGICANSAEDTGFVLNSIYGNDLKDSTSSTNARGDYLRLINMPIKELKIGIITDSFEKCLNTQLSDVVDYFKRNTNVTEISIPSAKYGIASYLAISSAETSANLSKFDGIKYGFNCDNIEDSRTVALGKEVKKRILLGNHVLSEKNYDKYFIAAQKARAKIINEFNDAFSKCDVIISPTTLTTAQKLNSPGNNKQQYSNDLFTVCSSLTGLPEITTTCGYDHNNLPIGFSIIGKAFDEATIISVADRFEQDFKRKEPIL